MLIKIFNNIKKKFNNVTPSIKKLWKLNSFNQTKNIIPKRTTSDDIRKSYNKSFFF